VGKGRQAYSWERSFARFKISNPQLAKHLTKRRAESAWAAGVAIDIHMHKVALCHRFSFRIESMPEA